MQNDQPKQQRMKKDSIGPKGPENSLQSFPFDLVLLKPLTLPMTHSVGGVLNAVERFTLTSDSQVNLSDRFISFDYQGLRIHVSWANVAALTPSIFQKKV